MTRWAVRRWARFGHDRLYAETPGGTALGYLDLTTGRYHSDDLANLPLLKAAIADHHKSSGATVPTPQPGPLAPGTDAVAPFPPVPAPGTHAIAPCPPTPAPGTHAVAPYPSAPAPGAYAVAPYPSAPAQGAYAVAPPPLAPAPGAHPLAPYPPPARVPYPYVTTTAIAAQPGPVPVPAPSWQDISMRPAGAAARQRALAERKAQGWLRHWVARFLGAKTEERAWRIGADGEQAVAEQLAMLDWRWRVLHAVPVGDRGSDIDHVVIGPAGVFTVNTKHHPNGSIWVGGDTFMVSGHRVPYIRNSRHEARRTAKLLTEQAGFPVAATGIIAVMGAKRGMKVKKQPEDGRVVVVQRRSISQYLNALPPRLTAHEIDAIFDVARRSTTWGH